MLLGTCVLLAACSPFAATLSPTPSPTAEELRQPSAPEIPPPVPASTTSSIIVGDSTLNSSDDYTLYENYVVLARHFELDDITKHYYINSKDEIKAIEGEIIIDYVNDLGAVGASQLVGDTLYYVPWDSPPSLFESEKKAGLYSANLVTGKVDRIVSNDIEDFSVCGNYLFVALSAGSAWAINLLDLDALEAGVLATYSGNYPVDDGIYSDIRIIGTFDNKLYCNIQQNVFYFNLTTGEIEHCEVGQYNDLFMLNRNLYLVKNTSAYTTEKEHGLEAHNSSEPESPNTIVSYNLASKEFTEICTQNNIKCISADMDSVYIVTWDDLIEVDESKHISEYAKGCLYSFNLADKSLQPLVQDFAFSCFSTPEWIYFQRWYYDYGIESPIWYRIGKRNNMQYEIILDGNDAAEDTRTVIVKYNELLR